MSLENEDRSSPNKASETSNKSQKQSKVSYTREFLLSLSELDVCKKLPSGFDQLILNEFGDALFGLQDGQRIPGNLTLQGFRRSDYGSCPPTRGDLGNYYRGTYGRWDGPSSSWSDKDCDSQSDWDSDYGRRYGHPSRRPWQNPEHEHEHDGLLGSGSFPRPSGNTSGISTPKVRSNDHYQLSRSNEPYHPPRPYKAVPHSRRDINDSYNDETFGSIECTNQDRMEEERRRRASFELMRKEQQKALQEKQKLNLDKSKDESVSINGLLEETKEKGLFDQNHELDATTTQPVSNNDSGRSDFLSQAPLSRPLVPPGFTSTMLKRNSGAKSVSHSHPMEVGKPNIVGNVLHGKANPVQNGILDNEEEQHSTDAMGLGERQAEDKSIHEAFLSKIEYLGNSLSGFEASDKKTGMDDHQHRTANVSEAQEALGSADIIEFNANNVDEYKILGNSIQDTSTSILDKLFDNAINLASSGSSDFIEYQDGQLDDSLNIIHSSKFAQWFVEEEKKPADDQSSSRASDLLSLIVGGEKAGVQVSDVKTDKEISPDFSYQNSEDAKSLVTLSVSSDTTGMSEQMYNSNKQEAFPAILTCEDLEQTILSEYSEKSSTLQPSLQEWGVSGKKMEHPKANVDDHASQHLLSLLQKGEGQKNMAPSIVEAGFSDQLHIDSTEAMPEKPSEMDTGHANNFGKSLTLETLFGTAFMKELQSVEAPVSVQRNSVGSAGGDIFEPRGLSFPDKNGDHFPDTEIRLSWKDYETNVLACNERHHCKIGKNDNWLEFDDARMEVDSSRLEKDAASKHGGFDGAIGIELPEEESLITLVDPVKPPSSMSLPAGSSIKSEFLASKTSVGTADKLALNLAVKDEQYIVGQEGLPYVVDRYNMESQIPYRDRHTQRSSQQFNPPPMSHGRLLFHPLDQYSARTDSHMFMVPENIMRPDTSPNHQYAAHMRHPPVRHHSAGMVGFDAPTHHPLLQQMQMPGDFPPPRLLHEVLGATPLLPHPSTQATNFMQEVNPIQKSPFGNRHPNVNGLGMLLPASNVNDGDNQPEAFQRLIEMELGTNSKQIHPFAGSHSRGIYGHELDMGFRY